MNTIMASYGYLSLFWCSKNYMCNTVRKQQGSMSWYLHASVYISNSINKMEGCNLTQRCKEKINNNKRERNLSRIIHIEKSVLYRL